MMMIMGYTFRRPSTRVRRRSSAPLAAPPPSACVKGVGFRVQGSGVEGYVYIHMHRRFEEYLGVQERDRHEVARLAQRPPVLGWMFIYQEANPSDLAINKPRLHPSRSDPLLRLSDLGVRISGFCFRVSVSGFRVSGFGITCPGGAGPPRHPAPPRGRRAWCGHRLPDGIAWSRF